MWIKSCFNDFSLNLVDFIFLNFLHFLILNFPYVRASLVAQKVKNLPSMQEMWVWPMGKDHLEKRIDTHSNVLAWRIPWSEELGGLQSMCACSITSVVYDSVYLWTVAHQALLSIGFSRASSPPRDWTQDTWYIGVLCIAGHQRKPRLQSMDSQKVGHNWAPNTLYLQKL